MRSLCSLPSGVWKTVTFASFWECTPFLAWPIRLVGEARFGWCGKTGQILLPGAESRELAIPEKMKEEPRHADSVAKDRRPSHPMWRTLRTPS